jgi:hypothetical protein
MPIDEQELRQSLVQTAARATAPQFTASDLGRPIARRRERFIAGLAGAALAVVALAVAVPVALSGTQQAAGYAPPPPLTLSYSITVNGLTQADRSYGAAQPHFSVVPGQKAIIAVDITVPPRATVTGVWLGITDGILTPRPSGPLDMRPVLVRDAPVRLGPGKYQFRQQWSVPASLHSGTSRQLSAEWAWTGRYGPGLAEGIIAELDVRSTAHD